MSEPSESKRVEKSSEEVAAQREVKKSEDAIRKLESKLKKQAEGSSDRAATQAEIDTLKARIAELCGKFDIESKADKKAKGKEQPEAGKAIASDSASTAASSSAAASSVPMVSTIAMPSAPRVDPARLKDELESCKAKLAAATDPAQMDELKMRLQGLLDACISLATEQASLATARASPAVVPQQQSLTPFQGPNHAPLSVPSMELGHSTSKPLAGTTAPQSKEKANSAKKGKAANSNDNDPMEATVAPPAVQSSEMYGNESTASDVLTDTLHPRFLDLAIRTKLLQVVGGNARALALVDAVLALVRTTKTLSEDTKELGPREKNAFLSELAINVEAVNKARPLCQGMKFVMTALTARINHGEYVIQQNLFVRDQVGRTVREIGDGLLDSIRKVAKRTQEVAVGDTILVFGRSSSIESLLINVATERFQQSSGTGQSGAPLFGGFGGVASEAPTTPTTRSMEERLNVIVLDSAPLFEGRGLAKRLQARGVSVRYALASAAAQVMPLCTKVFLGASVVMQSGDIVSRCGTAMVAACAKSNQKPVFFFAEDHKLTREVWIGSLTRNESVPAYFSECAGQTMHQQRLLGHNRKPTGHLYDVTPSELIDVVVTRLGRVHPTAVCSLIMPEDDDTNKNRAAELDEESTDTSPN